jgi:hypothetical protein
VAKWIAICKQKAVAKRIAICEPKAVAKRIAIMSSSDNGVDNSLRQRRVTDAAWNAHLELAEQYYYVVVEFLKCGKPVFAVVSPKWITRSDDGYVHCYYHSTDEVEKTNRFLNRHPHAFKSGDKDLKQFTLSPLHRLPKTSSYHRGELLCSRLCCRVLEVHKPAFKLP